MTARIFLKNNFYVLLAFSMLFCFFPSQQRILALHDHFFCDTENGCESVAHDWHCSYGANGSIDCGDAKTYYCGSWQVCGSEAESFMSCTCNAGCLNLPENYKYLNEPVNRAEQQDNVGSAGRQDANNVNLPVVIAWDNIPGWTRRAKNRITTPPENLGEGEYVRRSEDDERTDTSFDDKGPKSYRIQIQDTSVSGIDNLNLTASQKNNQIEDIGGKKAFYKVLDINAFNSRDNGGECFFKNNMTYSWRVKPCCDRRGTQCREDGGWQTFKTSAAPEPLYPYDPDWNGPKAAGDLGTPLEDFCKVKLEWCKTDITAEQAKFNTAKFAYATDYQLRVKSSENSSLLDAIGTPASGGGWFDSLKNALSQLSQKYLEGPIKEFETKIKSLSSQNLQESCHYLQEIKDKTNTDSIIGCKPNPVVFTTGEAIKPTFRPYFSSSIRSSDNPSLFSGDLIYSWQTKVCFSSKVPNNPDYCYDDETTPRFIYGKPQYNAEEKKYGQKWKFKTTARKNIESPGLKNPEDNADFNKLDARQNATTNKLVGFENQKFIWGIPCGANSFVYDIQKVGPNGGGATIFSAQERDTDGGRRIKGSAQVMIKLPTDTRTAPAQGSDPTQVVLEVDTAYQWHAKSCWPSNPLGDTKSSAKSICNDKWSPWFHFRTTGRPPKEDSLKTTDSAPNINFSWESVSGAKSYRINISGAGAPRNNQAILANKFSLAYPGPNKPYNWKVKTCADDGGNICGEWSASKHFDSGDFEKPSNLNPSGTVQQLPPALTWSSSAKYFQVTATFSGTADSSCDPVWFNAEYKEKKVDGNSMPVKTKKSRGSEFCTGDYWFKVQPCFDAGCTSLSANYSESSFRINDPDQKNTGLMVCGQKSNDPDTPYNEKEPCEIKHLVLTVKVIIDFITFKLALIILPILLLITGYFFYTAHGDPKIIETMKDVWRKIGIGYAFLIFAFLIVRILMFVVGYGYMWWQVL
jgi:hypothetical protein